MKFYEKIQINPSITFIKGKVYPFIEMANVDFYARSPKQVESQEFSSGVKFEKGDTIIARIEPCLQNGKGFYAKELICGFGSTEFLVFRPKDESVDNLFLYYYLQSEYIRKSMIASMTGATGRQRVNNDVFLNLDVDIPSLPSQHRIANILSAYDDLIENNQKQIKLLEEAAMRLYKEWFVNLRFPGHENTTTVGGVPEGWMRSNFESLCTLIKDTITPKDITIETPYIGLEHMPRKNFCLNEWGYSQGINSNKFRYLKNDVLFGKIRPYFHKVGFAITDGVCSTDAMVFRAKDDMFGLLLMTAFSEAFVNHTYQTCKEGAKMPRADWNEMKQYPVLIPHETILKDFNKKIETITKLVNALCMQIVFLKEARDKLLPKLMSGEIKV